MHEPGLGEPFHDGLDLRLLTLAEHQLVETDTASRVLRPLADAVEAGTSIARAAAAPADPGELLVFATAPSTPPASRYPPRVSVRPIRRFHVSRSAAAESSGSAPRLTERVVQSGLDQPVLEMQAHTLGRISIARRSSCSPIGPTSAWLPSSAAASVG